MELKLRLAGEKDAARIVQLINAMATDGGGQSPITEGYVAKYLASPASKVLLAESDGQVLGLLSYSVRPDLYHAGDACLVEELVVDGRFRSQGVGSALLTEVLSRMEAAGCAEISLAVMPDNARAIALYRRHGLTEEALFLEKHFGNL
jgi:ribosomal protein S18 acetylase RimI-like enzyme